MVDDRRIYEKLCLEGFQSGLSWLTILRKRESFRRAFADFDIEAVGASTSWSTRRPCRTPIQGARDARDSKQSWHRRPVEGDVEPAIPNSDCIGASYAGW